MRDKINCALYATTASLIAKTESLTAFFGEEFLKFSTEDYIKNETPSRPDSKSQTIINSPGLIKSGQNFSDLTESINAGHE